VLGRDFISIADFRPDEIQKILDTAITLKRRGRPELLSGRTLAMIFEKPSLRTRVSFQVAMSDLGGHAIYLSHEEVGLSVREPVKDVARVLSRFVDVIVARTYLHSTIVELAEYASVPVINALSDLEHPCQALADLLTILERFDTISGVRLAYIGDGNNVASSLLLGAAMLGARMTLACPVGYEPPGDLMEAAAGYAHESGGAITLVRSPEDAVAQADVVYTDVWTSMGQDNERQRRQRDFAGYTVNLALMRAAAPHAIIMHDLPAHRGEEIEDEALESPQAVVFDQAENRLHAQRALIALLLAEPELSEWEVASSA